MEFTHENHKSCATCFFTESVPGVVIQKNGSCNYCNSNEFKKRTEEITSSSVEKLQEIAEEIRKNRTGKYDCVIGASGGLDSSYVIYIVRKILGLNPLVVNYRNPFSKSIARENLKRICTILNVDIRSFSSRNKYDLKFVRSMSKALRSTDAFWGCCAFCNYILPVVLYNTARSEGIPVIFGSTNLYENYATKYLSKSFKMKFMINNLLNGSIRSKFLFIIHMMRAQYYFIRFKLENRAGSLLKTILNRTSILAILQGPTSSVNDIFNYINVTDYVPWNIYQIAEDLHKELGWESPGTDYLPMRFDCRLEDGFIDHTYQRAIGIPLRGIMCNNLIYAGIKKKSELAPAIDIYTSEAAVEHRRLLEELE